MKIYSLKTNFKLNQNFENNNKKNEDTNCEKNKEKNNKKNDDTNCEKNNENIRKRIMIKFNINNYQYIIL